VASSRCGRSVRFIRQFGGRDVATVGHCCHPRSVPECWQSTWRRASGHLNALPSLGACVCHQNIGGLTEQRWDEGSCPTSALRPPDRVHGIDPKLPPQAIAACGLSCLRYLDLAPRTDYHGKRIGCASRTFAIRSCVPSAGAGKVTGRVTVQPALQNCFNCGIGGDQIEFGQRHRCERRIGALEGSRLSAPRFASQRGHITWEAGMHLSGDAKDRMNRFRPLLASRQPETRSRCCHGCRVIEINSKRVRC